MIGAPSISFDWIARPRLLNVPEVPRAWMVVDIMFPRTTIKT